MREGGCRVQRRVIDPEPCLVIMSVSRVPCQSAGAICQELCCQAVLPQPRTQGEGHTVAYVLPSATPIAQSSTLYRLCLIAVVYDSCVPQSVTHRQQRPPARLRELFGSSGQAYYRLPLPLALQ